MPQEIAPTSIRLSQDLIRAIEREHELLERELGAKISRNAAIAMLIREAIAARKAKR